MKDEPRLHTEYKSRQVEAAHRVLVDLGQVLASFRDCLVVVGGDTYDICYCLTNFPGGLEKLAAAWTHRSEASDVKRALAILQEKFATVDGFGPGQVIEFLDLPNREAQEIQARRAFELVQKFLTLV